MRILLKRIIPYLLSSNCCVVLLCNNAADCGEILSESCPDFQSILYEPEYDQQQESQNIYLDTVSNTKLTFRIGQGQF